MACCAAILGFISGQLKPLENLKLELRYKELYLTFATSPIEIANPAIVCMLLYSTHK